MEDVIIFNKSLQERLQEYLDLFSDKNLDSVDLIRREWELYLKLTLDAKNWQAVWKISRVTCQEMKIPFPTLVLVEVESLDFEDLSANIKVLGVQDDSIEIQEHHNIPLMQLWPTQEQEHSGLFIQTTANALDMYRFFYANIFLPWDSDDDSSNWLEANLVSRLRLHYDLKNGVIPRPTAEHIRDLLTDARRIHYERENVQIDILDAGIPEENGNHTLIQELLRLNIEMIQIKNEMDLLENPVTRNIIIKRHLASTDTKPKIWLLIEEGKLEDYLACMQQVKHRYPEEKIQIVPSLQHILENMKPIDTLLLSKSRHVITSTSGLECGGIVRGLFDKESTTLASIKQDTMLDFKGNVFIENITINAMTSQCAILIRTGKTILKNCKLHGDNSLSNHQGIIVLKGAQLELIDCEISGFYAAVVGRSGTAISMKNCDIREAHFGVRLLDGCIFQVENCTFNDCLQYGLAVETQQKSNKSGDFKLLEIVPDIIVKDLSGCNNMKGNVIILSNTSRTDVGIKRKPCDSESSEDSDQSDVNVTVIERAGSAADEGASSNV